MKLRRQARAPANASRAARIPYPGGAPRAVEGTSSSGRRSRSRSSPRCVRRIRARTPGRPVRFDQNPRHRLRRCESSRRRHRPLSRAHRKGRRCPLEAATVRRIRRPLPPPGGKAASTPCPGERGPKLVPSTASNPSAPLSSRSAEVLLQKIVHVHAADTQQLAHVAAVRACGFASPTSPSAPRFLQSSVPKTRRAPWRASARAPARSAASEPSIRRRRPASGADQTLPRPTAARLIGRQGGGGQAIARPISGHASRA